MITDPFVPDGCASQLLKPLERLFARPTGVNLPLIGEMQIPPDRRADTQHRCKDHDAPKPPILNIRPLGNLQPFELMRHQQAVVRPIKEIEVGEHRHIARAERLGADKGIRHLIRPGKVLIVHRRAEFRPHPRNPDSQHIIQPEE